MRTPIPVRAWPCRGPQHQDRPCRVSRQQKRTHTSACMCTGTCLVGDSNSRVHESTLRSERSSLDRSDNQALLPAELFQGAGWRPRPGRQRRGGSDCFPRSPVSVIGVPARPLRHSGKLKLTIWLIVKRSSGGPVILPSETEPAFCSKKKGNYKMTEKSTQNGAFFSMISF